MSHYPDSPGWKAEGTSRQAAESMAPRAAGLRDRVLCAIVAQPCTADEAAEIIGETVLSTRPRTSELRDLGLIVDTGIRRPNISGRPAIVWAAAAAQSAQHERLRLGQ